MTIPGIGPLIAAAFLSEVNAEQFSSGRQLPAWCGLVPRQRSSGGKSSLSSMTQNGNRGLRSLIIHGARSVMHWAHKRNDALGIWLKRLTERRGKMKATVALANKLTRIVWRLLTESTSFDINRALSIIVVSEEPHSS
jgi:transposase